MIPSTVYSETGQARDNAIAFPGRFIPSVIFAFFYALIPWPQIWLNVTGVPMWDREVYTGQTIHGYLIYDRTEYLTLLDYITDEFLWGWSLRTLYSIGVAPGVIFNFIGFLFVLLASLIITSKLPIPFLLFLVNPLVIGLAFSQSRIALMMCVMYLASFLFKRWRIPALVLLSLTPLIHTSAPLFLLLYLISTARMKENSSTRSPFFPILAGVVVSALSGPLLSSVLTLLNDRRAGEYEDMSSGVLFLSMWILGMIYLLKVWPQIRSEKVYNLALAVMVLATSSLVFDSYASRFLAVLFPIIVVAISQNYTKKCHLDLIVVLFFVYLSLIWIDFFY